MPTALHPQAKFDPIPPDLDLHALVDATPNFDWVKRISVAQMRNLGQREFEKLVLFHVIQGGKPLVVERWDKHLPKSLFSVDWLERTYDKQQENVRDINSQSDIPMTMGHYLRSMKQLTNQWTPTNFRDERRQRLYLKDIDCPPEWHDRLRNILPPNLFYLNENVERKPTRRDEEDLDLFPEDRDPAPAGDLMSSLAPEMRAQNLMCYIGHEGTYTPAHKEMCASLGQNIMVDASGDDNGEKAGSSIWFMTETKDREVVREYFLSMLGHDIEIEKHFAQVNAWKKATFPVYVVEQRVGDFILVPPLAAHQVWNRGTRTVKVAWNRTTAETLEMALHESLPKARLVCRDEQYKNKSIVYFTLQKYYKQLRDLQDTADMAWLGIGQDLFKDSPRVQQLVKDFRTLFGLFAEILVGEMFATREKDVELVPFDSNITCSYCRANIFNRFLTCKHCVRQLVSGDEDTYDVCMECYAMGRSCLCISRLSWCEQWSWAELVANYEAWRAMVIRNDGFVDLATSSMPLEVARKKYAKKSVAQICQEELRRRPWKDITKHEEPSDPEPASEPDVDDEGRPIKKKRRSKKKKGDLYRCHVCSKKDYAYRVQRCCTPGCTEGYCYGVLYRAFDLLPQAVMENERWKCPKCLDLCNCGHCRRTKQSGGYYMPKNTLLGHDTRSIADDRSVDVLVDLRIHNLAWLKNSGDESRNLESKRMQRLRQAAAAEKAKDGELAENMPALSDAAAATSTVVPSGATDHLAANGYPYNGELGDMDQDQSLLPPVHPHDGPSAAVADMSLAEDESMYPDPSTYADAPMLGQERMVGMGYYQQDDSPDKILFDPYQEPSVEAVADDAEVKMSEYAKKTLRAAKRRAKQEEDNDPDFAAPRSHHRKRQRTERGQQQPEPDAQHQEALDNMDPDLFRQDTSMHDAGGDEAPLADNAATDEEADGQDQQPEEEEDQDPDQIHRPALRSTRPNVSYAEFDDGTDDFDDVLLPGNEDPAPLPETNTKDAAQDLDSAAVQTMVQNPDDAADDPDADVSAPASASNRGARRGPGRPRKSGAGRPPGRPSGRPVGRPPGRPGRPRKEGRTSSLRGRPGRRSTRQSLAEQTEEPEEEQEAEAEADEDADAHDPTIDELEAQLAWELAAFNDDGEHIEQQLEARQKQQSPEPSPPKPPKRKPGRPPKKNRAAAKPEKTARPDDKTLTVEIRRTEAPAPPPSDTRFMSMKERMALRGKKFKIGKRRSGRPEPRSGDDEEPAAPERTRTKRAAQDDDDDDYEPQPEPPASSGSRVSSYAPPSARSSPDVPAGPTIVRIGDEADEEEDGDSAEDDAAKDSASLGTASSSSFDDQDIAARPAPASEPAARGPSTSGRGRGRGRGRPWRRGRPTARRGRGREL